MNEVNLMERNDNMPKSRTGTALILASALGFALFVWLNWFPPGSGPMEAPMETGETATRAQAEEAALLFAENQFGPGDWRVFAVFDANAAATGYVSKEQPDTKPADIWPEAPLEFFDVEAEESESGTRLNIYVSGDQPRVIGWQWIGNNEPSDAVRLTPEAALLALGYNPSQFTASPDGDGMVFTHRDSAGELDFQLEVTVDGDRVKSVKPKVIAPAALTRLLQDFGRKEGLITLSVLLVKLMLSIGAIIIVSVYRKAMAFHRGIWLTLASFIPLAIYTVGLYPALRMPFSPGSGTALVLFQQAFNLADAVILYLSLVAGESLWRMMGFRLWPDMREPGLGKAVKRSVWLGYMFCFVLLGTQAVILFIGYEQFGVWTTADPMTDLRNQLYAGAYPLLAWTAAISEEGVYRLFAIAVLTLLFRPLWRGVHRLTGKPVFLNPLFAIVPAAAVASFLWGAAHVGYTVYPVYTRLIEVTLIGFVLAWIMLRYGLMAAIFAHAAVDLVWMGYSLVIVDSNYWALALAYMAMPIAAGYFAAWLATRYRRSPDSTTGSPLSP